MLILLSLLAFGSHAGAGILPADILVERQAGSSLTSTIAYSTLGYTSQGMQDESTIWGPWEYDATTAVYTSSSSYWQYCWNDYSYITEGSSYTYSYITSACPIWTTCDLGTLSGAGTSSTCVGRGYECHSILLIDSWGAQDSTTLIDCWSTSSGSNSTALSIFRTKPATIVSPLATASTTTLSSSSGSTPSPAPAPTTPIPSATTTATPSNASNNGGGGGSNNAGVIAGSAIGGIAVLGAIGVAVLFILKRSKRHEREATATSDYPIYQPEKAPGVPQPYDPHHSALYSQGTGSPQTYSPVPAYPEGYTRGELSGVMSPAPPNPHTGSPNVGSPPPSGYH